MRRIPVVAAAGVAAALVLLGAAVLVANGTHTPGRLGLPAAAATASGAAPGPGPSSDPLEAACGSPPRPGAWTVAPGAIAGFRAHEKFAGLEAPHEAVARTDRVAGWLEVDGDPAAGRIQEACIAVELGSLVSVDSLPGMNTHDRDGGVRDMLNVSAHPYARFRITAPVTVGSALPGQLEINGVSLPATATLTAHTQDATRLQAAGWVPVTAGDYGVEVPNAADFVVVDSHVTVEFSLAFERATGGRA